MKVRQLSQRVLHIDDANRAHVSVRVQLMDSAENLMGGQQVKVMEKGELIWDTDTDLEGEAQIDFIMDIVKETRKNLIIAAGRESREKVFLLDISGREVGNRLKQVKCRDEERLKQDRIRDEERLKQDRAKEQARLKQAEMENKKKLKRISECQRFYPLLDIGISEEDGKFFVIDAEGSDISGERFDSIDGYDSEGLAVGTIMGKSFLVGRKGEVLSEWYDEIMKGKDGCSIVKRSDKQAVIDANGQRICGWYDEVTRAAAYRNGILLRKGEQRAIMSVPSGQVFTEWFNRHTVAKNGENRFSVLNDRGEAVVGWHEKMKSNEETDVVIFGSGETCVMFDRLSSKVLNWIDAERQIALLTRGGKRALLSPAGKNITGFCDKIDYSTKSGLIRLCRGNEFAVMDKKGQIRTDWHTEQVVRFGAVDSKPGVGRNNYEGPRLTSIKLNGLIALMDEDFNTITEFCDNLVVTSYYSLPKKPGFWDNPCDFRNALGERGHCEFIILVKGDKMQAIRLDDMRTMVHWREYNKKLWYHYLPR